MMIQDMLGILTVKVFSVRLHWFCLGPWGITYLFDYGNIKGMEHVPNIFMSFDKYLFLEVINMLI